MLSQKCDSQSCDIRSHNKIRTHATLVTILARLLTTHSTTEAEDCATMTLQRLRTHRRGLGWAAQKKVYMLRKIEKQSWEKVASQVKNKEGETPGWKVCRDTFNRINVRTGEVRDNYVNCGSKPILTKTLRKWLVARLRVLRKVSLCTSRVLQRELVKKKQVTVEASTIRRALLQEGYKWLPRTTKPKFSRAQKVERLAFANEVMALTPAKLKKKLDFSMDGVVFEMPPAEQVARENFCHTDNRFVYRRPDEGSLPELAGHSRYKKQVPPSRSVPLWGGLSHGGFAAVLWHDRRKTNQEEWAKAVTDGSIKKALCAVNPGKTRGPWCILCDNESFLRAPESRKAHASHNIHLWKLPSKSPDLNPIEKFWGWTRKRLTAMDLLDLLKKRPVLGKTAYKARLKRLFRTQRAQRVASSIAGNLRTVAARVVKERGGAVRG